LTRLNALDVKSAGSDAFGLTNYNKLKTDIEYLTVAGADLASAATINPTAEFHVVTGTTTIDNITDSLGAVKGQQVRLLFKGSGLTIRNNGGGTGNIRTENGLDRPVGANELVTLVYDGTVWRAQRRGSMLGYAEVTASVTVTATTEGTANTVVTAPAIACDGVTPVVVEFYTPFSIPAAGGNYIIYVLFQDGSAIGWLSRNDANGPVHAERRFTPTAGSHTYSVRAFVNTGTATTSAGPAGSSQYVPAHLKISVEA
jgi:predicted secreted protein